MDREKVIKALESLHTRLLDMAMQDRIIMLDVSMVANAIDLLKEQEAIEPRNTYSTTPSGKVIPHIFCGKCNKEIYAIYAFCPFCGQAVMWE